MNELHKVDLYLRGRTPIIIANTLEAHRFCNTLKQYIDMQINSKLSDFDIENEYIKEHGYNVCSFDVLNGIKTVNFTKDIETVFATTDIISAISFVLRDTSLPAIYVFPNIHLYLEDSYNISIISSLLIEAAIQLEGTDKYIFLTGDVSKIPQELSMYCGFIDFTLPKKSTIKSYVNNVMIDLGFKSLTKYKDIIANTLSGLTLSEIDTVLKNMLIYTNGDIDLNMLFKEKANIVKKSGLLEVVELTDTLDVVGGLTALKEWSKEIKYIYSNIESALDFKIKIPKGVLLTGISGCGKSLFTKAIASFMDLPLYRLDIGRLFGGIVGETEKNTRNLWKLLESIAPAVVIIDEIEKVLSGMGSSDKTDGGVTARFIGSFLYYMEERSCPIFFVATANDISGLPAELLRKGRWDELWFVDLPNIQERIDIFKIHLKKRNQKLDESVFTSEEFKSLISITEGFTGAEIEQIVEASLRKCFIENKKKIDISYLKTEATAIIPLSRLKAHNIDNLRKWAEVSCRKASEPSNKQVNKKLSIKKQI